MGKIEISLDYMFYKIRPFMQPSNCYYCLSNVSNIISVNSFVYCSEKCVNMVVKACDYCGEKCNTKEHKGVFYNPYWFCSQRHYELSNPRIKFGVIGGPIGGPSGKPCGLPIGVLPPPEVKPSSPPGARPLTPPGLTKQPPMSVSKPIVLEQPVMPVGLPMPPVSKPIILEQPVMPVDLPMPPLLPVHHKRPRLRRSHNSPSSPMIHYQPFVYPPMYYMPVPVYKVYT